MRSIGLASLPRADWSSGFTLSLLLVSQLLTLAFKNLSDSIQDFLLVFCTLAILNSIWRRDYDCVVHDHLLIVPSDGRVSVLTLAAILD